MDANESIGIKDFDDPYNSLNVEQPIKGWGNISEEIVSDDMETGISFISGSDLNLQQAAQSADISSLEQNMVNSLDRSNNASKDEGYKEVTNDRHKNKRGNDVFSPVGQGNNKLIRLSENEHIVNMVFLKGKQENIATLNSFLLKQALLKIDNSLKPEQMKYIKDNLRITCSDAEQKIKILQINKLMGIEITTSSHTALNRNSVEVDALERVIIFGVSVDITVEQICQETGAVASKRLQKKMKLMVHECKQKRLFLRMTLIHQIMSISALKNTKQKYTVHFL